VAAELFHLPKSVPLTTTGDLMSGALADFFVSGTTTRQNTFTTETLAVAHANPVVADGNGIFPPIYLDDTLNYKVDITDSLGSSLPGYPVNNLASAETLVADLASNANALGASLVGIEDTAGNFTATNVETALAEVYTDLSSTSNTLGASLIGIEDSAGKINATTVEAALAEIANWGRGFDSGGGAFFNTNTTLADVTTRITLTANKRYSVVGVMWGNENGGGLKFQINLTQTPADIGFFYFKAIDVSTVEVETFSANVQSITSLTGMTNDDDFIVKFDATFLSHATTGGTIAMQAAQVSSSANSTFVHAGTWINVIEE